MEKMRLGKTGIMVSRIGFGGIPIQRLSEKDAIATITRGLDLGINYIDTAYAYGTSEQRIGKALSGRKEKPFIATKTGPVKEEIMGHLDNSLKTLGIDSIDLYQFHNVSNFATLENILSPGGALSVLHDARKKGKIKHIGISSHQLDVAKEIIASGQFETIMYPFNFVTCEGLELLELARKADMGFIAMKPFAGGRIKNVTVAIKYLLEYPDVLVLPGIGNVSQAEEDVGVLKSPRMTDEEKGEMQKIRGQMTNRFCRHCDYCMPCPQGIAVSMILDYEPLSMGFPDEAFFSGHIAEMIAAAMKCDNCGECEKKCPYNIPVRAMISEYVKKFDTAKKQYLASQNK